jgi:threonine aldolase
MPNQIAIKCHTQPGDEIICDELSHIYQYEGGGIGFNAGCFVKLLHGDRGRINASIVKEAINNASDIHKAHTSLVSLENTANRGGGSCYNFDEIISIKKICDENNLKFHLDGARLFNALIAKNEEPKQYGQIFDSISICLSKGLGAPVGSILLGNAVFIAKAKRIRKILGGGMRQAGYLAAAGMYALNNHVQRLAQDHFHAKQIEEALLEKDFVQNLLPAETNIIIFKVSGKYTPQTFCEVFRKNDIKLSLISPQEIRMVTHLNITPSMVQKTIELIRRL